MKSYVNYIAVLDKQNVTHFVEFTTGVNIITGKSSTGKSAMIEIFDYCFGNSDYTIPSGIITDNADLYFIVIYVKSTYLILARNPNDNKAFLKEETNAPEIEKINKAYFQEDYFISLNDFKIKLGNYFGLIIVDTDVDLEDKNYRRNNAKSQRPSIRHFTSFMLQHQNLIANKHSIFYRFDEKEKRELTIDQFKIFVGFVDQDYFIKKQKLNELERELKALLNKQKEIDDQKKQKNDYLTDLLKEFIAVIGKPLLDEKAGDILRHPASFLDKIQYSKIDIEYNSREYILQYNELNRKMNSLLAQRRKLHVKLEEVISSIEYAKQYKEDAENTSILAETTIYLSECPFCKTKNENLSLEANSLEEAINWLNSELSKTPYLLDSFLSEQKEIEKQIADVNSELFLLNKKIQEIEKTTIELEKNKSLEEQGLKIKLKIENLLEERIRINLSDLANEIEKKDIEIKSIAKELRDNYNPEQKLRDAEKYINQTMEKIGSDFEFEEFFKPINLKFSLDSFELWHEKQDKTKVFLRSMGSGANWLYCHLTLFTSLHRYFCVLKNQCLIPPILFLDQPSQVYFPTSIDNDINFNAIELKKKEGKVRSVDEDLKAVTNIYNQLVKFCSDTLKETGIEPQIIITDHADNLDLENDDFERLVNGRRWRTQGFIKLNNNLKQDNEESN